LNKKKIELDYILIFLFTKQTTMAATVIQSEETAPEYKDKMDKMRREINESILAELKAKEDPAKPGIKYVAATYHFTCQSIWVIPDNIDEEELYVKYDELTYGDLKFPGFVKLQSACHNDFDYKRPDKVVVCEVKDSTLFENEVWFDCNPEYDEDEFQEAKEAVAAYEAAKAE
jgi:hypothetical protein